MLSDYYYIPELSFFFIFYVMWGVAVQKYAPSPGRISKITPFFYWMYYSNLVSLVHWISGIVFPLIIFYVYGFQMNREALYIHHFVMWNSTAYFIYDFIIELYYDILDIKTALHHIAVFSLGIYYFWNPYGGDEYIMTLLLGELANPCLISRTIFKTLRKTNSVKFVIIEAVFAVSFLALRLAITPLWLEAVLSAENCPFECKFGIAFVLFEHVPPAGPPTGGTCWNLLHVPPTLLKKICASKFCL